MNIKSTHISLFAAAIVAVWFAWPKHKPPAPPDVVSYLGHQFLRGGYNPQTGGYDHTHLTNCTNSAHQP